MSWSLLNKEIDLYLERQQTLQRIAAIVALHPAWLAEEPELEELLAKVLEEPAAA